MVVLKSVLRPSRFGFGGKIACESSSSLGDGTTKTSTSCDSASSPQEAVDGKDSHIHAGRIIEIDDQRKKPLLLHRKPSSSRRVRGLWNERHSCSSFAQFQVELISDDIFSFLTLEERIMSALTCRRFAYCCQQPGCWTNVDATSYVKRIYDVHLERALKEMSTNNPTSNSNVHARSTKLAKERTSAALIALITGHKNDIQRLVIRNIEHRLSSDVAALGIGACLAAGRLGELTLTDYLELTDASVSVLFLSRFCGSCDDSTQTIRSRAAAIPTQRCLNANTGSGHTGGRRIVSISPRFKLNSSDSTLPLRRPLSILRLEHCPLLTDKVIRLIATNCSGLSELSLRGCQDITDAGILALLPMINRSTHTCRSQSSESPNLLLMPSSPRLPALSSTACVTPPTSPMPLGRSMSTPNKPATNSLASLFETSSPSSVAVASSLPSSPSSFLSIFDQGTTGSCGDVSSHALTRSIPVQKTTSLPLIRPKQAPLKGASEQTSYLKSLDLVKTGVTVEGLIALCSSGGQDAAAGDMLVCTIDEVILSSQNSETSHQSTMKLRSLLRNPNALNVVVGNAGEDGLN